jgi:NAD(P)-dependent dehydrogenase (short-subunit alcohol dehydrogenase family)
MGRRPDGGFDPALRARAIAERAAGVPIGRLAVPDDVAEVALFLASDAAAYLTGQAINVAGGAIMH